MHTPKNEWHGFNEQLACSACRWNLRIINWCKLKTSGRHLSTDTFNFLMKLPSFLILKESSRRNIYTRKICTRKKNDITAQTWQYEPRLPCRHDIHIPVLHTCTMVSIMRNSLAILTLLFFTIILFFKLQMCLMHMCICEWITLWKSVLNWTVKY